MAKAKQQFLLLKLLDGGHPAAKTLVDIAGSEDTDTSDGTTVVILLAEEFLKQVKSCVKEGLCPQIII
jgi:chaperonin GroEL (HSP60 family)